MANTRSAEKRARQSARRHLHNKSVKSAIKTAKKRVLEALQKGDAKELQEATSVYVSRLDKAAKRGIIHRNTANRNKSRISTLIAKRSSQPTAG
ncbi:MAG: 30S ribosomal protein S20 [Chthoniobacterales bacterium]|nr:30S ribosomal protein S20 [Chthoniobacterales bacterium]